MKKTPLLAFPTSSSSKPQPIDPDLLMPTTKYVGLLPGAKPLVFKRDIDNDHFNAICPDSHTSSFEYQGITVTFEQYNEICTSNSNDTACVTPDGAAWLLELYAKGLIPMSRKSPGTPPEEAIAYSRSHDELVRRSEQNRAEARARAEAYAAELANPNAIPESEFTYTF